MQFKEKLMEKKNQENGKKTNFGPDIGLFSVKFVSKTFFVGFNSTRYYTLLQAIIVM